MNYHAPSPPSPPLVGSVADLSSFCPRGILLMISENIYWFLAIITLKNRNFQQISWFCEKWSHIQFSKWSPHESGLTCTVKIILHIMKPNTSFLINLSKFLIKKEAIPPKMTNPTFRGVHCPQGGFRAWVFRSVCLYRSQVPVCQFIQFYPKMNYRGLFST